MQNSSISLFRICLALLVLSFGLRLGYVLAKQTYNKSGTAGELERAAVNLAETGELGNVFSPDSGKSAHLSPLYPVILSRIYLWAGTGTRTARLVQELLSILIVSVGIAYLPILGRQAGLHPGAGIVAGLLMALLPANLWVETSGSWTQPYAALLLLGVLACFFALHARQWQSTWLVISIGLLTGVIGLLSPSLLPVVGIVAAAEWLLQPGKRRRVALAAVTVSVMAMICIAPWLLRNYQALHGWVPLRSNFGLELWVGNNPWANGKTFTTAWDDPNMPLLDIHPYGNRQEQARLQQVGELAYMDAKKRQALEWINHHPFRFARLTLERARLYWIPPVDMWSPSTPGREWKSLIFCLAGIGALAGLAGLFWQRHPHRWLWLAALMGPSLAHLLTHVDTRYRYPTFALSMLLGCHFLFLTARWLRSISRQPTNTPQSP